jgi:hypothetical protein
LNLWFGLSVNVHEGLATVQGVVRGNTFCSAKYDTVGQIEKLSGEYIYGKVAQASQHILHSSIK